MDKRNIRRYEIGNDKIIVYLNDGGMLKIPLKTTLVKGKLIPVESQPRKEQLIVELEDSIKKSVNKGPKTIISGMKQFIVKNYITLIAIPAGLSGVIMHFGKYLKQLGLIESILTITGIALALPTVLVVGGVYCYVKNEFEKNRIINNDLEQINDALISRPVYMYNLSSSMRSVLSNKKFNSDSSQLSYNAARSSRFDVLKQFSNLLKTTQSLEQLAPEVKSLQKLPKNGLK